MPNNLGAGGILYENIIRDYGLENFSFISVSYKNDFAHVPKDFQGRPIKQFSLRFGNNSLFFKILKKLPIIESLFIIIKYLFLKKDIIKYIQAQKFDIIFAPLRGEVLLILNDILKTSKRPLYAMVEDTVEREIDDHRLIYGYKRKNYYKLLPMVQKLAVAGETMQGYFKSNFNIDATILRPSFSNFSQKSNKKINECMNILFAGNIYANKEMKYFLQSLLFFASTNKNIKVNYFIAAHRSFKVQSDLISIINIGWVKEDLLNQYIEKCHIAYLPYKSEHKFMHSMKYAFPAKAGFYISKKLPIFFHGPSYSSFNTFLSKYEVGISCDSFDPKVLSNKLTRFVSDPSFYLKCQRECQRAYEVEYDNKIFSKRVQKFFA
jgi:hypothetical protein